MLKNPELFCTELNCLLLQENAPLIGFAMASGVCIFFGNMGLMYALCLSGVTIAVPLFSSFIVIVGRPLSLCWKSFHACTLKGSPVHLILGLFCNLC